MSLSLVQLLVPFVFSEYTGIKRLASFRSSRQRTKGSQERSDQTKTKHEHPNAPRRTAPPSEASYVEERDAAMIADSWESVVKLVDLKEKANATVDVTRMRSLLTQLKHQ